MLFFANMFRYFQYVRHPICQTFTWSNGGIGGTMEWLGDIPIVNRCPGAGRWAVWRAGRRTGLVTATNTEGDRGTMARLPDKEGEQSKLTNILRAMGNSKRMRILSELSDGRERSVSELEGVMSSLSQSALSQHLARLRRANIVKTRRESQTIFYSINYGDVLRILRLLGHLYDDDPVMKRTRHWFPPSPLNRPCPPKLSSHPDCRLSINWSAICFRCISAAGHSRSYSQATLSQASASHVSSQAMLSSTQPFPAIDHVYLPANRRSFDAYRDHHRAWWRSRVPVRPVRGWWRIPDDAIADLFRHPTGGGSLHRSQPDCCLIGIRCVGTHAPRQCRFQNGSDPDDRRRDRLDPWRCAVFVPARYRADRSRHPAVLCGVSGHHWRTDADREPSHHHPLTQTRRGAWQTSSA